MNDTKRFRLNKETKQAVDKSRDIYSFTNLIVTSMQDKEVFTQVHLKDVDIALYNKIITDTTSARMTMKQVFSRLTKASNMTHQEKLKRHPSLDKLKVYRTQTTAYSDILEIMHTYQAIKLLPPQIIQPLLANPLGE